MKRRVTLNNVRILDALLVKLTRCTPSFKTEASESRLFTREVLRPDGVDG